MSIQKLTHAVVPRRGYERYRCVLAVLTLAAWADSHHVVRTLAGAASASVSAQTTDHRHAATSSRPAAQITRTYYIAADVVDWDYAPTGTNQIAGRPFNDEEKRTTQVGPTVIGRQVRKALYREYTDDTFKTLKPRPAEWEHLGIFGPIIRAQVGDTLRVVFRNNTKFPASMHPHNVLYDKSSEGALYNDGTAGADKVDDGVPTGGTYTYIWRVPERAGPSEHEGSSTISMYHSHTDEVRDVASGLFGPMIITKRGMAKPDGTPTDVDREIVAGFLEIDEANSWFLEENIQLHAKEPSQIKVRSGAFFNTIAAPDWDSYFRETINGFSYGHTPGLTMRVGERVRWYLMSGTDAEFHTPHWHGNVVNVDHMRTDMVSLMAMGMTVADMVPDNPGKWLFHCHVSIHMKAGMQAFYVVEPAIRGVTRSSGF